MPYRRLPNTDQARLRALQVAIFQSRKDSDLNKVVVTPKLILHAETYLNKFEKLLSQYKQALDTQVSANKNYQQIVKNARLYISHFIQVLNLSVLRNEIKREHKSYYHLEPNNFAVPDLSTESSLLEWGQNLIDGESQRTANGGSPMLNPTIAKLNVHYDKFKTLKTSQKIYQQSTARYLGKVAEVREEGDAIILEIWNEVEAKFAELPPYDRLIQCQSYGLVYYYRRGEKELTPEDNNNLTAVKFTTEDEDVVENIVCEVAETPFVEEQNEKQKVAVAQKESQQRTLFDDFF